MKSPICPVSKKRRYQTLKVADKKLRQLIGKGRMGLAPYGGCPCGAIHLGRPRLTDRPCKNWAGTPSKNAGARHEGTSCSDPAGKGQQS